MKASQMAMVLLGLVAVAHLVRVIYGWDVTIGTWNAPMWVSYIGVVIPGGLAFLLFKENT
jgi:hypothetical protein